MTGDMPLYILSVSKARALDELNRIAGSASLRPTAFPPPVKTGSFGRAAKAGDIFLAWSFTPSTMAVRAVENILAMYLGGGVPHRIFYLCYAGTHSSITAGSLHLGKLPEGQDPSGLSQFDRRTYGDIGVPCFLGTDAFGSEVYAMGTGWHSVSLEKALCDLVELASPESRACFCRVRYSLNLFAKLGGFMSRRCRIVRAGRALINRCLKKRLPEIRRAVDFCLDLSAGWKDNQGQPAGEVIWADGPIAGRVRRPG